MLLLIALLSKQASKQGSWCASSFFSCGRWRVFVFP